MARRARVAATVLVALLLLPSAAHAAQDPYRSQQWALDDVRADEAWEVTRGAGAIVAVIDTGVDLEHPDLRDRILRDTEGEVIGLDLVGDDPTDRHGHGTLVAGIIAATSGNGEGIAGLAPQARVMPIRVLDDAGAGRAGDVGTAIRWAVDHGADVINLSLESLRDEEGRSSGPGAPPEAVEYAWDNDVVVVVASGNGGAARSAYDDDTPALVVGASGRDGGPAAFSDNGGSMGVLAPGVEIVSTWCRDRDGGGCDGSTHAYGVAEGTSFAAPHVAGLAALLSADGYDAEEIVTRIRRTVVRSDDADEPGRVDAAAALGVDGDVGALASEDEAGDVQREAGATPRAATAPAPSASPPAPADPEPATSPAPAPEPDPAPDPPPKPAPEPQQDTAPEPEREPDPEPAPQAPTEPPPRSAESVALVRRGRDALDDRWLQLLAAGLVGVSLATWSAAARRYA